MMACLAWTASTHTSSEGVREHAVIWNGFDHEWSYNHRLARLGDYVGAVRCSDLGCEAQSVHTGATGSGSDAGTYTSRLTAVSAPRVGFLQGATTLHVESRRGEGEVFRRVATVELPAHGLLTGREQLEVVLGGFDLRSLADPDKLAALSVHLGRPQYASDGSTVRFEVETSGQVDCDSIECDRFERGYAYDLTVAWTLVAADDEIVTTYHQVGNEYQWRRRGPGAQIPSEDAIQGASGAFPAAFVGLRGFSIRLDDDHHLRRWAISVQPSLYTADSGIQRLAVDLAFEQGGPRDQARLLSFRDSGWTEMGADLVLVQLRSGEVQDVSVDGQMAWEADGGPPDPTLSTVARTVTFGGEAAAVADGADW